MVNGISERSFQYCSGLTSVVIGDSITIVGDYAFNGCSGLANVAVGNSVTNIGYQAFYDCNSLATLSLGISVVTIGSHAFWGCSSLISVVIPSSTTTIDDFAFSGCSSLNSLTLGDSVNSIGAYSFLGCASLTSLIIPDGVVSIGPFAFYDCSALSSVVIGEGVTTIGSSAFQNCNSLISLTLPSSLSTIGSRAFQNCSSLTDIIIPDSVTTIEGYTFIDCTNLVNATIGSGVTFIGAYAFSNCTALTNLTIGNAVATIGDFAFQACNNLADVTIPDAVTSIGSSAFYQCGNLTNLYLGSSLSTLDVYAFAYCNHIAQITSSAIVPPSLGTFCFFGVNSNIPVTIPCESGSAYSTDWDCFNNFVQPYPYELSVRSGDEAMGTVQVLTQPSCVNGSIVVVEATADSGYHFSHWNNGSTDNPFSLTVVSDTSLVAFFDEDPNMYSVIVVSGDSSMGSVVGGGVFEEGTSVTITALSADGYHFVSWNDADTANPRTITLMGDTTFTAYFEVDPPETYTIIVISSDTNMGTVSGSGTYISGEEIVLCATALTGYRFLQWQDANTEPVRTIVVTSDETYTAYFSEPQGVSTVDGFEIHTQNGSIVIQGAENEMLVIYDVLGRIIVRDSLSTSCSYTMPQTGLYLVKVGDRPAKKMVVVK